MENIQPWCISRQLFWGHQIPAWYGWALDDDQVSIAKTQTFVAESGSGSAVSKARDYYKCDVVIVANLDQSLGRRDRLQDSDEAAGRNSASGVIEDVLDTWFSSGHCGRSRRSAGRTRRAEAEALLSDRRAGHRLRHHLLLGRAHDDVWACISGRRCRSTTVYIHAPGARREAAPRCRSRRATSSTRSNVIDEFGADALRFTLARDARRRAAISSCRAQRGRRLPQFRDQAVECLPASRR